MSITGTNATGSYATLLANTKVDVAGVSDHDDCRLPRFLTVKQVSSLLHINEKKIYSLASEGHIPATKITGKWLFPLNLIEQWLVENSHQGVFSDRLLIAGSDDPLTHRVVAGFSNRLGEQAQIHYSPSGTRKGLALLDKNRIDACLIHWGPAAHATLRHLALIKCYRMHDQWVLTRIARRKQGLLFACGRVQDTKNHNVWLTNPLLKWVKRNEGSSSQRLLNELCINQGIDPETPNYVSVELSERATAASIVNGSADIAAGSQAVAKEFGLGFIALGEEVIDIVTNRKTYFRTLFQNLLEHFTSTQSIEIAQQLGGYRFIETGQIFTLEDHKATSA